MCKNKNTLFKYKIYIKINTSRKGVSFILTKLLIKLFVKEPDNINNETTRNQYGLLGGFVGIISNLLLFTAKLIIGLLSSSISILADAFNNLSDCTASIITLIGFKLTNKPATEKHPFGYGRAELISGLIISFMVMMFGFEFLKISFNKLFNPEIIAFSLISFFIIIFSILVKIWLAKFNFIIGDKINSASLKASSLDAKGDVLTSSCVAISFFASQFTSIPIDAIMGIIVSFGILYSGFNLVKETISPLIGEAPSSEIIESITNILMSYDGIESIHDLIIHNYGINKYIASVHAEMPVELGVFHMHEIVDDAEKEVFDKLNIELVIHMDPICNSDEDTVKAKEEIEYIISKNKYILSMHDFRVVGEGDIKNLIFDIVVNPSEIKTKKDEHKLSEWITNEVKKNHPLYNCVIKIDKNFN